MAKASTPKTPKSEINLIEKLDALRRYNVGIRKLGHNHASEIYELAQKVKKSDELWKQLEEIPFFANHRSMNRKRVLLYLLAYIYGSLEGPNFKRASAHFNALKVSFEKGASKAEVYALLEKHGFDGLKSKKNAGAGKGSANKSALSRGDHDSSAKYHTAAHIQRGSTTDRKVSSATEFEGLTWAQLENKLIIDASEEDIAKLCVMKENHRGQIKIKRDGEEFDGFKLFKLIKMRIYPVKDAKHIGPIA